MRNRVEFILPTSWEPDKKVFLAKLGISNGGLGEHFFGNVYDALFTYSMEMKKEFQNYYSVEYENLNEYIEITYGEFLGDDDLDHKYIFLVTKWLPNIVNYVFEDNKMNLVLECIAELEEAQNENQT